jgi:hypothetical protein
MTQTTYVLIHELIRLIPPFITPLCFVFAWAIVLLTAWSITSSIWVGIANVKQMHQIPCANCQFFTQNYYLKCPVHPSRALSDEAINCPDYEPQVYANSSNRDF